MPVPTYFTTSPIDGGTPVSISVPPVGGIIYDFVGNNGVRVTAFVNGSSMPAFTSSSGTSQLLNSATLTSREIAALGGGIRQLAVRLTVSDGDSTSADFDFNKAFLRFNSAEWAMNTSVMQTYSHDGTGNTSQTALVNGYPNNQLATGWGLVTDATVLSNLYNSIVSTGKIDLYWQSANTGGGNVLNFTSGLAPSVLSYSSVSPNIITSIDLFSSSDTGFSDSDNLTSQTTPTFGGETAPSDVLQIYAGSTFLGTTTADSSGNWSFTVPGGLAFSNGIYNITARVVDGSGNVLATSAALPVTIDVAAGTPGLPDLTSGSDTGFSNSDNITSATTQVLTGTAEANSSVEIFRDGTSLGTATADGSGVWTYNANLGAGVHAITVQATDAAGNVSAESAPLSITVDATAPTAPGLPDLTDASDTGASNTDNITSATTQVLTGTAEANSSVEIFRNGTSLGTVTADGSGIWTYSANLGAGVHAITVRATDAAGNVSAVSSPLSITVDTTAPGVPGLPDLTDASDTGASNSDNITSATTQVLTGTAEANSSVEIFRNGTSLGTVTADGSGVWTYSANLGAGVHAITVKATDAAGNVSAASAPLSITVDTTAPTAPGLPDLTNASDTGSSNSDNITSATTQVLTGTAEANSSVEIFRDGTSLGTVTADGSGVWTYNANLGAGVHAITVRATDAAGNASAASSPLSITVDTTAPTAPGLPDLTDASDTGSSNSDNITSATTQVLTGTAEANSSVEIFRDGTAIGTATADGSGVWTYSANLSAGVHAITVKATDAAGNASAVSSPLSITVDSAIATPGLPDLVDSSDSGSSNSDNITNRTNPTLSGTAEANSSVEIYSGTTLIGTTTANSSGIWTLSPTLAEGVYSITAKATDAAGNTNTSSALSLTIDTTVLTPSDLDLIDASDLGQSLTDNLTSDTTPTISGKAGAGDIVKLYRGTVLLGQTVADSSGNWSVTPGTALADGIYNLTAEAEDAAGNVSGAASSLQVTIDNTAPVMPEMEPDLKDTSDTGISDTDNNTGDNTPEFVGTLTSAEAGMTVTVYSGLNPVGTGTVQADGSWAVTASALENAVHDISYTVTDAAGNESLPSPVLLINVDATMPEAPAIAPDLIESSDTGMNRTDDITADATPTFRGEGGPANQLVRLYANGIQVGEAAIAEDGTWLVDASTLAPGIYDISATYVDQTTGNESSQSPALSIEINPTAIVPPTAPRLNLTPTDGGANGGANGGVGDGDSTNDNGGLTNDNTPALQGVAEPGTQIEVFVGSIKIGDAIVDDKGNWTLSPTTSLPDGTYTVTVKATTPGGGTTIVSPEAPLVIDTKPASVEILNFGSTIRDTSVNRIDFKFSETVRNVRVEDLILVRDGQPVPLAGAKLSTKDGQVFVLEDIPGMTTSSGVYEIRIKPSSMITDRAGNALTVGASDSWLTGYTADAMPAIRMRGRVGMRMTASATPDRLLGGKQRDILRSGIGDDRVNARGGNDRVMAGAGNDIAFGSRGNDLLNGGNGRDILHGGRNNDRLVGGGRNDRLIGNSGNDVLVGGRGRDVLLGGAGVDTFQMNSLRDRGDRVIGFSSNDRIDLRGVFRGEAYKADNRFAQYYQYTKLVQVGSNTEVRVDVDGSGSSKNFATLMTLQNVNSSLVQSTNFVIG